MTALGSKQPLAALPTNDRFAGRSSHSKILVISLFRIRNGPHEANIGLRVMTPNSAERRKALRS